MKAFIRYLEAPKKKIKGISWLKSQGWQYSLQITDLGNLYWFTNPKYGEKLFTFTEAFELTV